MDAPTSTFVELIDNLKNAPTAPDAKAAADKLAREVSKAGPNSLTEGKVLESLQKFATNKTSGSDRESGALAFSSLATICGGSYTPFFLPYLPTLFDLYMDKGDVVRTAASTAVKAILKPVPPESMRVIINQLEEILESGKWRTKVGVLNSIKGFVAIAPTQVADLLGDLLPKVEKAMHDTKSDVSSAAIKCATSLCTTLANPDLLPHIPVLVQCMANPDSVPSCIKALSSTTFVAEVTAPALAVLVPLLIRALNDRSMEVQRRTVVIIDNLVKLVRDESVVAIYLSGLVEGVRKIAKDAAFPEVRAFGQTALDTLHKAGASSDTVPPPRRDISSEASAALTTLKSLLPSALPQSPLLDQTLAFQSSLVADLIHTREFRKKEIWERCVGVYASPWLGSSKEGLSFGEAVREHYLAIDEAQHAPPAQLAGEGELLCNTLFSLAYGALLLLSHTHLTLYRGRRYGILGTNGSGKSTLMRQLRDGKVEGFPGQDVLRTVMVEHSLQGEDTGKSIVDFVAADPALSAIPKDKIRSQLLEVGFDATRQEEPVSGLSGGWKMKLELARAMLYNADLLLLDEPTNHLDRASVKWLEEYLIRHTNVTCLIVSHDSGFLDNVTTDIIHYESKKLVYYPGNLSAFVAIHPDAKSYYTLSSSTIKFAFPPPGSLMGVRSNTRAILKMVGCTFTYPGRDKPSLIGVSCALSLSSRVGIVGPNGAGKSTLIKLLTGETVPQEGTVYKHPALRVGYVSQHATHHIERHLEKTPIGYIQWRFQDGHDRELLEKTTRVLSPEEQKVLDQEWVGKDGSKRKMEMIMGRQKLKKSFQYEVKWRGLDHRYNTWVPREDLIAKGFTKLIQQFDDLESSREGAGSRDTAAHLVRKHLEDIGLDGDIAQYNEISGLSGGQKIKLVIAACLWNNPQICVLDEPSNFLDRDALGGLAVAIRDWAGAVVIISHNNEFVSALCPEIWNIEAGRMTRQGKTAVVEDAFADLKSPRGSGANTPRSRLHTPIASASGTPAASGDEGPGSGGRASPLVAGGTGIVRKKKKKTRNQMKAQEERRRLRHLKWLAEGGPKPEDTDSDVDPSTLPI
ncbi:hypothetical protein SISNIDRAFT_454274 [Sistotremastrum niveocremeum HHB9708]|uniref:Elongation factor 3 n=1 Tax=Sistotremastrum niveocremeum HHB9708 TaxID=1314777 RepID=A0A164V5E5_9AGAM|nr:hypothetical protein SISNIDRAFT_454274 [Sistotremastrum niveocremeum HHB9708]